MSPRRDGVIAREKKNMTESFKLTDSKYMCCCWSSDDDVELEFFGKKLEGCAGHMNSYVGFVLSKYVLPPDRSRQIERRNKILLEGWCALVRHDEHATAE